MRTASSWASTVALSFVARSRVDSVLFASAFVTPGRRRRRIDATTTFPVVGAVENDDVDDDAAVLRSLTFYDVPNNYYYDDDDDADESEDGASADLLAEFLMELGALSSSICEDGDNDDERRRGDVRVSAHFASSFDLASVVDAVRECLYDDDDEKDVPRHRVDIVAEARAPPVWLPDSGFVIRSPRHSDDDVARAIADGASSSLPPVELVLSGGAAFGGRAEHPTTRLCLRRLRRARPVERLLDYGAGSGVLALAATACGAAREAVGVDVDRDAARVADANARRNGAPATFRLSRGGDHAEGRSVAARTTSSNDDDDDAPLVPGSFDAAVANLTPDALAAVADELASAVRPGAEVLMSGFRRDNPATERLLTLCARKGLDDCRIVDEEDGWVLVRGVKR